MTTDAVRLWTEVYNEFWKDISMWRIKTCAELQKEYSKDPLRGPFDVSGLIGVPEYWDVYAALSKKQDFRNVSWIQDPFGRYMPESTKIWPDYAYLIGYEKSYLIRYGVIADAWWKGPEPGAYGIRAHWITKRVGEAGQLLLF